MNTSDIVGNILSHHGVKGMRWGVRRRATVGAQEVIVSDRRKKVKTSGGQGFPAHSDAVRAHTIGQIRKKSGAKALSDQDLQAYTRRLQLEQSAQRLTYQNKPAAHRAVLKILGQAGQQQANEAANQASAKLVKKVFTTAAVAAA